MSTPIGDPRRAGEQGPAGDQRPAGEQGVAGDPRPAGEQDYSTGYNEQASEEADTSDDSKEDGTDQAYTAWDSEGGAWRIDGDTSEPIEDAPKPKKTVRKRQA